MELNERERVVLLGVLRDRERLAAQKHDGPRHSHDSPAITALCKTRDAQRGIVKVDLAGWLGRSPTASEHTMYCRTYRRLAERGLVDRLCGFGIGARTSRLRLTSEGERVARELERAGAKS